jgi:hypothetical protein
MLIAEMGSKTGALTIFTSSHSPARCWFLGENDG